MSIQLIKDTSMQDFIKISHLAQKNFLKQVNISELKGEDHLPLLKKFIAMNLLMEVRKAAKNHSSFNLTAGFRDLIANISPDLQHKIIKGQKTTDILYPKEGVLLDKDSSHSYRLFHVSDIGGYIWNRKFFKIAVDVNNNIITQKANTRMLFSNPETNIESAQTWVTLNDEYTLKMLFKEIEKKRDTIIP